jgi:ATP-dependent protease ClpP protease subunit
LKVRLALLDKVPISKVEGVCILRTLLFSGPSTVHFSSNSIGPSPEPSSVSFGRAAEPVKETQDAFQRTKSGKFLPQPILESTVKDKILDYDPVAIGHRYTYELYERQTTQGRTKLALHQSPEPFSFTFLSLIDSINNLPHPVDVSIRSTTGKAGFAAFLHSRGLSSMLPQARVELAPPMDVTLGSGRMTNSDMQQKRWLNDTLINQVVATEWIQKAGMKESDRTSLLDFLKAKEGMKTFNPLQLLHQGTKGAIDYIEVGTDRAVTRQDLNAYMQAKHWDAEKDKKQIEAFLQDAHHVYQIPSRPLNEIYPKLFSAQHPTSEKHNMPTVYEIKETEQGEPEQLKQNLPFHKVIAESRRKAVQPRRLENPDQSLPSILHNDSAFFSTGVDTPHINQLCQALGQLDQKRQQENSSHHIAVFISSGGGETALGRYFIDYLKQLKTPVDIIVSGLAGSAGAMCLLTGATGNRLATPHSLLMLHESHVSGTPVSSLLAQIQGSSTKEEEESLLRYISERTGRSFAQIRLDTKQDYWLNPLEALFYGDKGLLDGVVVGPDGLVTREDTMTWLTKKMGSKEAVEKHIQERLERRRDMNAEIDHKFDVNDPFDNFAATLEAIAAETGHKLGKTPGFTESGAHPNSTVFEHTLIKDYQKRLAVLLQSKQ